MKAIKLARNESERARLKTKCMKVLARAEEIKKLKEWSLLAKKTEIMKADTVLGVPLSSRTLTTTEQVILLEGSKLHGMKFPPWTGKPNDTFFDLTDGELYKYALIWSHICACP
jgi:calpain-7